MARKLLPHGSKVLFLELSVSFLFVTQISPERLNGFAPNSQGRRVWSLAWTSLNVKVTRDKTGKTPASSPLTMHCKACATHCKWHQPAADGTILSQPWGDGSACWWRHVCSVCLV